jgi:hypothetical protein
MMKTTSPRLASTLLAVVLLALAGCALDVDVVDDEGDDLASVEQASTYTCIVECDDAFYRDRARCYAEPRPISPCLQQEYQERWACHTRCQEDEGKDPYAN